VRRCSWWFSVESEVVPLLIERCVMETWGSEGIAPRILRHGTSLKLLVRFTTPQRYPWHKGFGNGSLDELA
jgi:hypothetical protein